MTKTTKKEIKKEVVEQLCTCCGEIKRVNGTYFYKSYSVIFKNNIENRMTECKDCVLRLANTFIERFGSDERGLYELCRILDIYYDKTLYEAAKSQAKTQNSNINQIYFQKVLSLPQYRGKTFIDSDSYERDIDNTISDDYENRTNRWGNLPKKDIEYLDIQFDSWITRHKCETRAEEILYEEICQMQLDIKKIREGGGDTVKKVEALQKLMASANIRPLDQNAMAVNENMMLWGTIVDAIEKHEPCEFFEEEKRKEYKDFKGYRGYFKNWVKRPLRNLLASHRDYNIIPDEEFDSEFVDKYEVGDNIGNN